MIVYNDEQLHTEIEKLPEPSREAIRAVDVAVTVNRLTAPYELTLNEMGAVYEEVKRVLLGETGVSELPRHIAKRLDPERQALATGIAQKLSAELLDPITQEIERRTQQKRQEVSLKKAPVLPPIEKETAPTPPAAPLPSAGPAPADFKTSLPPPQADEKRLREDPLLALAKGTPYSRRDLEVAYAKVPEEVRRAVTSVSFEQSLQDIGKKFSLNVDRLGEVASEAGLLMLGLTEPLQFVHNLERRLTISHEQATAIGQAVNASIFRPVRGALKEIYDQPIEPSVEPADAIAAATPPPASLSEQREELLAAIEHPPTGGVVYPSPPPPAREEISSVGEQTQVLPQKNEKKNHENGETVTPDAISEPLSSPTVVRKEVKHYTVDPYREPIE